ncbi:MAG: transposase [Brucella sp.]|uniref:transposase n=1 Tax=Brucella/Ochrobactrum group TaxID=2826938 RepID=UPI0022A65D3F|nr:MULTISPECIES: transposase [Brucella/Ochrobactrum group]
MARLIFIDETSTNTRLTKRTGWSAKGSRFADYAPFGNWKTQTFIAGLCCHGLTAPWIVDAPMNSRIFEKWIVRHRLCRHCRPVTS